MKYYLILAVILIGGLVSACNQPAVPVEYGKACVDENDKKNIEVSGFLTDQGAISCSNFGGGPVRCGVDILEAAASGKSTLSADIERGASANNIEELKSGYKREDIKIHDNNGNVINLADKVKITGKLNTVPGTQNCFITVTKIEK